MPTTQKHTPEQIAYLLECTPAEARVYAAAPALVDALKVLLANDESTNITTEKYEAGLKAARAALALIEKE